MRLDPAGNATLDRVSTSWVEARRRGRSAPETASSAVLPSAASGSLIKAAVTATEQKRRNAAAVIEGSEERKRPEPRRALAEAYGCLRGSHRWVELLAARLLAGGAQPGLVPGSSEASAWTGLADTWLSARLDRGLIRRTGSIWLARPVSRSRALVRRPRSAVRAAGGTTCSRALADRRGLGSTSRGHRPTLGGGPPCVMCPMPQAIIGTSSQSRSDRQRPDRWARSTSLSHSSGNPAARAAVSISSGRATISHSPRSSAWIGIAKRMKSRIPSHGSASEVLASPLGHAIEMLGGDGSDQLILGREVAVHGSHTDVLGRAPVRHLGVEALLGGNPLAASMTACRLRRASASG